MLRAKSQVAAVAALLAMGALTAACSSNGVRSSGGNAATAQGVSGVAAAKAYEQRYLANPTSIEVTKPLSKKPAPGRLIVGLPSPNPVSSVIAEGWRAGAEALGWSYKSINVGTDPEGIQTAFSSALSLNPKPYAIIVSGFPKVTFAQQLAQARAAGVAVVSQSTTDPVGDGIVANPSGGPVSEARGRLMAAHVVTETNGNAHVALVTISSYPILDAVQKGFQDGLKDWCPACTVDVLNVQQTDIGSTLPSQIVSEIQRNPQINTIYFTLGDFAVGTGAALKAAGLSDKVRITGSVASTDNLAAVKAGTADAFTGFPAADIGWLSIDAIARYSVGDDVSVSDNADYPTQIITQSTVNQIVTNNGYYEGAPDVAAQWKRLWGVS